MKATVPAIGFVLAGATALFTVGLGAVPAVAKAPGKATAATACTATDAAIYAPPAAVTLAPGSLLACESTALPQLSSSTKFSAWKVQYATTNLNGVKGAASGTVIVPTARWTGLGTRPMVVFNPGSLGLGSQCAFSKQLSGAYQDEYESSNLNSFLAAGYAVAATDGIGYLNGQVHPYVVGLDSAHAVLDMAKVASIVPGSGISPSTKIGIAGYSEGGAAALWAGQDAASYAPSLHVVGDAAGGMPGNLRTVAASLDGGAFAGFLVDAVLGLSTAYPTLPFTSLLNQSGRSDIAQAKTLCVVGTVASFAGHSLESDTTAKLTLTQIYALGNGTQTWGQEVDAQQLGVGIGRPGSGAKYTISFPTYQYQGLAEEVVAPAAETATKQAYCSAGITTQWAQYPGEHLTTDAEAVGDVTSWLGDRFTGLPTFGNCLLG